MPHVKVTMTGELADYLRSVSLQEPEILQRLREETAAHPMAGMQITPEQGQFMAVLVHLLNARLTLEVGVFTGYSSLAVVLALPADGKIIACDISSDYTATARKYWREAGVESKIDLRLAPAIQTLDALIAEGRAGTFDFAFIDADKENYANYYERALVLLRPGGLIAVDNVLWHGRVIDPAANDADTQAIRAFNEKMHSDQRVWHSMLPVGDGLTLAVKRTSPEKGTDDISRIRR
jgi:predicted O-methyltransferase YrrM